MASENLRSAKYGLAKVPIMMKPGEVNASPLFETTATNQV